MLGQEFSPAQPFSTSGILTKSDFGVFINGTHIYPPSDMDINQYIGKKVIAKGYTMSYGFMANEPIIDSITLAEEREGVSGLAAGFPTWAIFLLLGAALFMFFGKKK